MGDGDAVSPKGRTPSAVVALADGCRMKAVPGRLSCPALSGEPHGLASPFCRAHCLSSGGEVLDGWASSQDVRSTEASVFLPGEGEGIPPWSSKTTGERLAGFAENWRLTTTRTGEGLRRRWDRGGIRDEAAVTHSIVAT
jgi:hypothetical protein